MYFILISKNRCFATAKKQKKSEVLLHKTMKICSIRPHRNIKIQLKVLINHCVCDFPEKDHRRGCSRRCKILTAIFFFLFHTLDCKIILSAVFTLEIPRRAGIVKIGGFGYEEDSFRRQ